MASNDYLRSQQQPSSGQQLSLRELDGATMLVLLIVIVAVQMLLHLTAVPLEPPSKVALAYTYGLAAMGALIVFAYSLKYATLTTAANYFCFYTLIIFWVIPHKDIQAIPLVTLYWLVAFVFYMLWAVWQDHVPFLVYASPFVTDHDAFHGREKLVRLGFNIVEWAIKNDLTSFMPSNLSYSIAAINGGAPPAPPTYHYQPSPQHQYYTSTSISQSTDTSPSVASNAHPHTE